MFACVLLVYVSVFFLKAGGVTKNLVSWCTMSPRPRVPSASSRTLPRSRKRWRRWPGKWWHRLAWWRPCKYQMFLVGKKCQRCCQIFGAQKNWPPKMTKKIERNGSTSAPSRCWYAKTSRGPGFFESSVFRSTKRKKITTLPPRAQKAI